MATKEERSRQRVLSLLGDAEKISKASPSTTNSSAKVLPYVSQQRQQYRDDVETNDVAVFQKKVDAAQTAFDTYKKSSEVTRNLKMNMGADPKYDSLYTDVLNAKDALQTAENNKTLYEYQKTASTLKDNKDIVSKVDAARAANLSDGYRAKEGDSAWDYDRYKAMTDDEVELYNRLAKNGQEEAAENFLSFIDKDLDRRVTEQRVSQAKEKATDSPGAASVASVLLNTFGGIQAGLATGYSKYVKGEAINQYDPVYLPSRLSNTYRSTVAENIEAGEYDNLLRSGNATSKAQDAGKLIQTPEQLDENNRKIASFLYTTGMSVADCVAATPFGATGMQVIMASNAAASTLIDAKDRGATDAQAITMGVIAGIAEAACERFSIERLFSGQVSTSMLKAAAKQAGCEASEEMITEFINLMTDATVMRDKSSLEQSRDAYIEAFMAEGMTEAEAAKKAGWQVLVDSIGQIVQAGAAGALSGGVMGSAADIINARSTGAQVVDAYAHDLIAGGMDANLARAQAIQMAQEETQAAGAELAEDTAAYKLAQRNQDTSKMSIGDIGRQYAVNREQVESAAGYVTPEAIVPKHQKPIEGVENTGYNGAGGEINGAAETENTSVPHVKAWQESARSGSGTVTLHRELEIPEQRTFQTAIDGETRLGDPRTAHLLTEIELTPEQHSALRYAEFMSGNSFLLYDPGVDVHVGGFADPSQHYAYINIRSEAPFDFIAGHEFTHARPDIERRIIDAIGELSEEELNHYNALYKDESDPRQELAAHALGTFFYTMRTGQLPPVDIGLNERMVEAAMPVLKQLADEGRIVIPNFDESNAPLGIRARFSNDLYTAPEGYNIKQQTRTEVETPNDGRTAIDRIGSSDMATEDVKKAMRDQKQLKRKHEQLKGSIKLDSKTKDIIETLVKEGSSVAEVIHYFSKGDIKPKTIAAYYTSYQKLHEAEQAQTRYRKGVLRNRHDVIDEAIGDRIPLWEDKATGFQHAKSTQERNARDVADSYSAEWMIENIFKPQHQNEAARIRWHNDYVAQAKALIKTEAESKFTSMLMVELDLQQRSNDLHGKAKLTKAEKTTLKQIDNALDYTKQEKAKLQAKNKNIDETRCKEAADKLFSIYGETYDLLTDTQIRNGMPVTERRNNYSPIIKDKKGRTVASFFGIDLRLLNNQELPTSIAGMTEFFSPGKPWFAHDLHRTGFATEFDALASLDEYLKTAGDVIFHTDDIQNVRMLESVIRERTTENAEARNIHDLLDEDKLGEELYEALREGANTDRSHLARYAQNLHEHGNLLANKKSVLDRPIEYIMGRRIYRIMNNVRSRITKNVMGANFSAVMSNIIPLTQASGVISYTNLARGIYEAGQAFGKDDGFNDRSTFVTNRKGYQQAAFKDSLQKFDDAIGKPFQFVDEVVASAIVRGRYYDNIANGMNEQQAMQDADAIAAAIIADRSKGALPTMFGAKNPIVGLLTAFQIESVNQIEFLTKDLKIEADKKSTEMAGAAMALILAKMFIAAFAYNELRKKMGLSENALDPIGMVMDVSEEMRKGIEGEQTISETAGNIWDDVKDPIPIIGGGRYGSIYENALPDFGAMSDAWQNIQADGTGKKYFAQTAAEELSKPVLYLGLPTAGGQVKKTFQALKSVAEGGSYKYNKQDEKYMQYAVDKTLPNVVSGALFGKSGLKENKEWKAAGFPTLSPNASEAYQSFKEAGGDLMSFTEYSRQYDDLAAEIAKDNKEISALATEIANANPMYSTTEAKALAEEQLGKKTRSAVNEWIAKLAKADNLTEEQKMAMIGAADIDKNTYQEIKGLVDNGVGINKYLEYSVKVDEFGEEYGTGSGGELYSDGKKAMQRLLMKDSDLTAEQKVMLSRKLIDQDYTYDYSSEAAAEIAIQGKTAYNKYAEANKSCGISAERYLEVRTKIDEKAFKGTDENGKTVYYLKQARLANYVDNLNESEAVKKYIWDSVYSGDDDCEYENRHNKLVQRNGIWQTSGGMY